MKMDSGHQNNMQSNGSILPNILITLKKKTFKKDLLCTFFINNF